jgi:hypothetical protein
LAVAALGGTSVLPADPDADGGGDGDRDEDGDGDGDGDGDAAGRGGSTLDAHDVTNVALAITNTSAVVRQPLIWFEISTCGPGPLR